MERDYHLELLLEEAENLRLRSYETMRWVELVDSTALLEIYSYNHGTRFYVADIWSGVWVRLENLEWREVSTD